MIEQTTANPILTFDQLRAIDASKKMLGNLESEITNAQNKLKVVKIDCDRAVKDFEYREQLLKEINPKIDVAKSMLEQLNAEIINAQKTLDKCIVETNLINETNVIKYRELTERQNGLSTREQEHQKQVEKHSSNEVELLKEKETLKKAKEAFLRATEHVTW